MLPVLIAYAIPGVMFSVARSRLALPVQFLFLIVNALGVFVGIIYNSQTPDLYENNAHHKIGWIATWVMVAEVVMGLLFAYSGRNKHPSDARYETVTFLPVPPDSRQDDRTSSSHPGYQYRWSRDSGQGTERSSSSLNSLRTDSPERGRRLTRDVQLDEFEEKPIDEPNFMSRKWRFPGSAFVDKHLARRIPGLLSQRVLNSLRVIYIIIERTILPLGFISILTGAVTYGGISVGYSEK